MVAQLAQDLVHLERGEDRLDQHRRLDRAARDAELSARSSEHVVPQPRLEVALHLGQIEVRARAARHQRLRVVEEVQAEVERAHPARGLPSTRTCFSGRCQPRGRTSKRRDLSLSAYFLPSGLREADRALDRIAQVDLALRSTLSQVGVSESSKSAMNTLRAGVERVDDHLAVDRAGDLDAAILQVGGNRRDAPLGLANLARLRQKVGQRAGVDFASGARRAQCSSAATRSPKRRVRSTTNSMACGVRTVS